MKQSKAISILKGVLVAILTAALALGGLIVGSRIFLPKNNDPAWGMIDAPAHGAMGEPLDSIDVLFIGDSEVSAGFSPLDMFAAEGIVAHDCSSILQSPVYCLSILSRVLEYQSPKIVVIETNTTFNDFTFSDALMREITDLFPFIEFHSRWKSLRPEDFTNEFYPTWTDDLKGYWMTDKVVPVEEKDYKKAALLPAHIDFINTYYLEQLIKMIREDGAVPVFVSSPSVLNWNEARHDSLQKFADDHNIEYIDMNTPPYKIDIDWNTETMDHGDHLNNFGAVRASTHIASILKQKYNLPDRRDDPLYASYHEKYNAYVERRPKR